MDIFFKTRMIMSGALLGIAFGDVFFDAAGDLEIVCAVAGSALGLYVISCKSQPQEAH